MNDASLIQVENLYRYYGTNCAVQDVSLEVRRGEVVGFLGPNGAGKSTTMLMISGNLAPSAGRILINGIDILDNPRAAKAELGFLPEQPPLYRELTVDEYLAYCTRLNRIVREQRHSAIDNAKQRCGLTEVGHRLIGNLSKGFQQRVGLAQAIIHSPAVIILDEPTVGLDPIQIREIRTLIRELANEHSVILSTHILPEVQAICNRVLIIHKGRLVLESTIEGIQQQLQGNSLVVAFKNLPALTDLEAVPGITDIESLADDRIRLRFTSGNPPTDALVEMAVANKWGLCELTPEQISLEQIFINITCRDDSLAEPHDKSAEVAA